MTIDVNCNGKEIESVHIRELKLTKDAGGDIVARFEETLAADGRVEPVMTPARKSERFKKTTDRFLKEMESAIADAEYRSQINAELIASLNEKLQQLERLITST